MLQKPVNVETALGERLFAISMDAASSSSDGTLGHSIRMYLRRKYYHYTLWTGIYMMDDGEATAINVIFVALSILFVRWCTGLVTWMLTQY